MHKLLYRYKLLAKYIITVHKLPLSNLDINMLWWLWGTWFNSQRRIQYDSLLEICLIIIWVITFMHYMNPLSHSRYEKDIDNAQHISENFSDICLLNIILIQELEEQNRSFTWGCKTCCMLAHYAQSWNLYVYPSLIWEYHKLCTNDC